MTRKAGKGLMRMKQLTEASGVPRGTIQFYIKEGLVPRPIKTHPNMAYYSDNHVEAIRLVKELQSKRFLPLSVIKQIMGEGPESLSIDELRTLTEIDGKLFRNLKESPRVKPLTARQLRERTGVSPADLEELEACRILHPLRKGSRVLYEEDDIRLVECWTKLRAAGFTRERGFDTNLVLIYRDWVERLVEEEARLFLSRVTGRLPLESITRMVEEATALSATFMELLHKKMILETVTKYTTEFQDLLVPPGTPRMQE